MRFKFNMGDDIHTCTFGVGNRQVAQFNSRLVAQIAATHGVDNAKAELKKMMEKATSNTGLQMTPEHDKDLTDVVDKYVDLIMKNQG